MSDTDSLRPTEECLDEERVEQERRDEEGKHEARGTGQMTTGPTPLPGTGRWRPPPPSCSPSGLPSSSCRQPRQPFWHGSSG